MLFQTLLQLNILICATPALAGWMLVPMGHAGAARQAGVVWQRRAVETAPPKIEAPAQRQRMRAVRPATLPRPAAFVPARPVSQPPLFVAAPTPTLASFHPFPHAIRAP